MTLDEQAGKPSSASPHSLYRAVTPEALYPALDADLTVDTAIVGAGFTGLSSALHLLEQGGEVAVFDAHEPGWGASGRNGGQVNPGLKREPSDVVRYFGAERGERLARLSGEAPQYVFDLVRRLGIDCDAVQSGSIRVVRTEAERPVIDTAIADWSTRGARLDYLDRARLSGLLGSDLYPSGLLDPRGGHLNPLAYARGLAAAVARSKGRIFSNSRVSGLKREGEFWRFAAGSGAVRARQVVLATNGYTDGLWPGLRESVVPIHSAIAATDPLPETLARRILPDRQVAYESSWRVLYFRLDRQNRLLMGGPALRQQDGSDRETFRYLIRRAEALYPDLRGVGWSYFWNGQVAVTQDHLPHLHEPAPGLVAALGYNGRGIAMATMMGRIVAKRLSGASEAELELPVSTIERFRFHKFWKPVVGLRTLQELAMDRLRGLA